MAKSGDLYDVLGVAKDASPQDIKKAFRVKARECHPDVAGNDPGKAEAFKRLREAYEVLSDPAARSRYDRRGQPRTGGPFYGSMWNRGTVNVGAGPQPTSSTRAAGNDLDLEDIFNDFSGVGDFGFTGSTRGQPGSGPGRFKGGAAASAGNSAGTSGGSSAGTSHGRNARPIHPRAVDPRATGARAAQARAAEPRVEPPTSDARSNTSDARPNGAGANGRTRAAPQPGRDVSVPVDVPAHVAAHGGSVTVTYVRLRRADDGHTLYRYDELHDLKVPPGTRHGDTLRVERLGDAGLDGGPFGDLVVDVRVTGRSSESRGSAWDPDEEGARADAARGSWGGFEDGSSWGGGAAPATPPPGGQAPRDPPEEDGPSRRRPPEGVKTSAWSSAGWSRRDDRPEERRREEPRREERREARDERREARDERREARDERREPGRMRMPGHEAPTTADGAVRVDVGVVAALLGGRVTVPTPAGPVRVNIPPGTSSGTRMRLRGRGPAGADGMPTDVVAEVRIVVPKALDDESRRLIERFAALNPTEE